MAGLGVLEHHVVAVVGLAAHDCHTVVIFGVELQVFLINLCYLFHRHDPFAVHDRCCSINRQITEKQMKSVLLASAWNEDDWTMTALEIHYETLCKYKESGQVPESFGYLARCFCVWK